MKEQKMEKTHGAGSHRENQNIKVRKKDPVLTEEVRQEEEKAAEQVKREKEKKEKEADREKEDKEREERSKKKRRGLVRSLFNNT